MRLKHSVNAYVWVHHQLARKLIQRKHHARYDRLGRLRKSLLDILFYL